MENGKNYMRVWRTLTGMTLAEAVEKMLEVLPPAAYKKVPGPADLTDISPAYMLEKATMVFGLLGVGWRYDYRPEDATSQRIEEERKSRDGQKYTVMVTDASILRLNLQYRYVDEDGLLCWSEPVWGEGGSKNENDAWARRGAVTNALGACFAKLLWQLNVYKDILSHENAGEKYAEQQKKKAATRAEEPKKVVQTEEPKAVQTEEPKKVVVETPVAVVDAPKTEMPQAEPKTIVDTGPMSLEDARKVIVPVDVAELPQAVRGKTLAEVEEDPLFGAKRGNTALLYLAKKTATKSDKWFDETSSAERLLVHQAALVVLASYEREKKKK